MNTRKMLVLIVEDEVGFAALLREAVEREGHSTVCLVGAYSLDPCVGIGIDHKPVPLAVDHFDLAFVDGRLYAPLKNERALFSPSVCDGPELMRVLSASHVPCLAMSTMAAMN